MSEAMESLMEDMQEYRNELASHLFTHTYENPVLFADHIKNLGKLCTKYHKQLAKLRRECCEGLIMIKRMQDR